MSKWGDNYYHIKRLFQWLSSVCMREIVRNSGLLPERVDFGVLRGFAPMACVTLTCVAQLFPMVDILERRTVSIAT